MNFNSLTFSVYVQKTASLDPNLANLLFHVNVETFAQKKNFHGIKSNTAFVYNLLIFKAIPQSPVSTRIIPHPTKARKKSFYVYVSPYRNS